MRAGTEAGGSLRGSRPADQARARPRSGRPPATVAAGADLDRASPTAPCKPTGPRRLDTGLESSPIRTAPNRWGAESALHEPGRAGLAGNFSSGGYESSPRRSVPRCSPNLPRKKVVLRFRCRQPLRRSAAEDDRGWSPRVVGVFGPLEFLLICLAGWRPSATNARPPSADIRPRNGTPPPPPRSPFRSSRRAARAANRWPDGQAARQRRGSGQSRVGRSRGGW